MTKVLREEMNRSYTQCVVDVSLLPYSAALPARFPTLFNRRLAPSALHISSASATRHFNPRDPLPNIVFLHWFPLGRIGRVKAAYSGGSSSLLRLLPLLHGGAVIPYLLEKRRRRLAYGRGPLRGTGLTKLLWQAKDSPDDAKSTCRDIWSFITAEGRRMMPSFIMETRARSRYQALVDKAFLTCIQVVSR